eukprot:Skav235178  [mRNA]  locus=scaffold721:261688:272389:- [translate_table: standard]
MAHICSQEMETAGDLSKFVTTLVDEQEEDEWRGGAAEAVLFTACACGATKWAKEERHRLRKQPGWITQAVHVSVMGAAMVTRSSHEKRYDLHRTFTACACGATKWAKEERHRLRKQPVLPAQELANTTGRKGQGESLSHDEDSMRRIENPTSKHILVADLGGGTFDVCIVRKDVEWDQLNVLFTAGDERLGGNDFDNALVEWCLKQMILV